MTQLELSCHRLAIPPIPLLLHLPLCKTAILGLSSVQSTLHASIHRRLTRCSGAVLRERVSLARCHYWFLRPGRRSLVYRYSFPREGAVRKEPFLNASRSSWQLCSVIATLPLQVCQRLSAGSGWFTSYLAQSEPYGLRNKAPGGSFCQVRLSCHIVFLGYRCAPQ